MKHFYTNTKLLLALWKDLTKLFQKQVELLKNVFIGEVMREINNWPLSTQYMDNWHDGAFDVNMTSSEVVLTHHHRCRFLRRYLVLKIKPNTGQKLGNTDKREIRTKGISLRGLILTVIFKFV